MYWRKMRYIRESNNMTQKELAQALGVSLATYNNYERGATVPKPSFIRSFAAYFGVDEKDIVNQKTGDEYLDAVFGVEGSGIATVGNITPFEKFLLDSRAVHDLTELNEVDRVFMESMKKLVLLWFERKGFKGIVSDEEIKGSLDELPDREEQN